MIRVHPDLSPIADALVPGHLVMFGEIHGTVQAPDFVACAASQAANRGPIVLALELPEDLQPAVDAFLAADAHGPARAGLLATPNPFWSWRDGRSSLAMVALLGDAWLIRRSSRGSVRVLCFDGRYASGEERDRGMAAAILHEYDERAIWIVHCGNLHARSDEPRWMGWHLRQRLPHLVALDLVCDGGNAWVARGDGPPGVYELGPFRGDWWKGVRRFAARDARGFDGTYHVGPVHASPPAVDA